MSGREREDRPRSTESRRNKNPNAVRQARTTAALNVLRVSRKLLDLTDVCREGDFVDGGVQVDDVRRSLEGVEMSRQPLQGTQTRTLCVTFRIPFNLHPTRQLLDYP